MSEAPVDTPKTAPVRYRIQTIDIAAMMTDDALTARRQDYLRRCLCRMFPRKSMRANPFGVMSLSEIDDSCDPLAGILAAPSVTPVEPADDLAEQLERVELEPNDDDVDALYDQK